MHLKWTVAPLIAVAAVVGGCASDTDVTTPETDAAATESPSAATEPTTVETEPMTTTAATPDRPADGVLGAAAVSQALDINLSDEEQFATACGIFTDNPEEFAQTIAAASGPVGGDAIQPTSADILAWGNIACS